MCNSVRPLFALPSPYSSIGAVHLNSHCYPDMCPAIHLSMNACNNLCLLVNTTSSSNFPLIDGPHGAGGASAAAGAAASSYITLVLTFIYILPILFNLVSEAVKFRIARIRRFLIEINNPEYDVVTNSYS